MNACEPIVLYRCRDCSRPVYKDGIEAGKGCVSCGSRYVQKAPPTFNYIFKYLWHNGLLLKFVWENVLKMQKVVGDA